MGDVNGDGYADLVAGAYGYSIGKGQVYVFHGSSLGISVTQASLANQKIIGEANNNFFGWSVSLGDINGDGYADLASGANGYNNTNTGCAYMFHGSATGISATMASSANQKIIGENENDYFGHSVAQ